MVDAKELILQFRYQSYKIMIWAEYQKNVTQIKASLFKIWPGHRQKDIYRIWQTSRLWNLNCLPSFPQTRFSQFGGIESAAVTENASASLGYLGCDEWILLYHKCMSKLTSIHPLHHGFTRCRVFHYQHLGKRETPQLPASGGAMCNVLHSRYCIKITFWELFKIALPMILADAIYGPDPRSSAMNIPVKENYWNIRIKKNIIGPLYTFYIRDAFVVW